MSETNEEELYNSDEEYKDIIGDLSAHCPHIVAQILEYLTVRELCLFSCVSKSWRNTLSDSYVANKRRLKHLKKIRKLRRSVGQENWPIKRRTPAAEWSTGRRDALSDIRNVYRTRKPRQRSSANSLTSTVQTPNTRQRVRDMGLRALR